MPRNRVPNAGPYIVSWTPLHDRFKREEAERHLWIDACYLMRQLLIEGAGEITVRFA